jgi:hypothetical protein
MSLAQRTVTSITLNAAATAMKVLVLFIQSILLARLLPVEVFGIYGFAAARIKPYDALNFLILTLRTALLFNPLRVFLLPGSTLMLMGIGLGFYQFLLTLGIAQAPLFLFLSGLQLVAIGLLADLTVSSRHRR